MIRFPRAVGPVLLAVALLLTACADVDVRGRAALPAPPEQDLSALDQAARERGEIPEDLAFTVDPDATDPITPWTEVIPDSGPSVEAPERQAPVTLIPTHVRFLGPDSVEFGYDAPFGVEPGDRLAFTSGGWTAGAEVEVLLRPGYETLGTFAAIDDGSAFGFIQLPDPIPGDARLQFVSHAKGMRTTDTIYIADRFILAAERAAQAAEAAGEPSTVDVRQMCALFAQIETTNAGIQTVLAGATVDTTLEEVFWWPDYQAQMRLISPSIEVLRQLFIDAAAVAPAAQQGLILQANEDDAKLLDGIRTLVQESMNRADFDAAVIEYRGAPEIAELEQNQAVYALEEYSSEQCGVELTSFTQ